MSEVELEFIASMKALLVRYGASFVYVNSRQLAVVTDDETLPDSKFIYISAEDLYKALAK